MALGLNLYNMVLIQWIATRGFFFPFMDLVYFYRTRLWLGTYRNLSFWCKNRAIGYISIGHRSLCACPASAIIIFIGPQGFI
mgnify:CR=1 FL=1